MAAAHLEALGYRILQRNFRCPAGEIDLIALDGRTLVFVEVKSRHAHGRGRALEAITPAKQRQIERAALFYLARNPRPGRDARFDAVAIDVDSAGTPGIELIRNAFPARRR